MGRATNLTVFKYEGAGNDFVVIDDRNEHFSGEENWLFRRMCDRRFGFGADGLILLREKRGFVFEMLYFNSDGARGTLCGNGGRCAVAFARKLGLFGTEGDFWAADGAHQARYFSEEKVELRMKAFRNFEILGENEYLIDTGSPHYVTFVENVAQINVAGLGFYIRHKERFSPNGVNVNFVEVLSDGLKIRTFERGVEAETLSCGTGAVAVVWVNALKNGCETPPNETRIFALGGTLVVRTEADGSAWLCGPARLRYEGRPAPRLFSDDGF